MKKVFQLTVAIALLAIVPLSVNAQCKGFAKKMCKDRSSKKLLYSYSSLLSFLADGPCATLSIYLMMPRRGRTGLLQIFLMEHIPVLSIKIRVSNIFLTAKIPCSLPSGRLLKISARSSGNDSRKDRDVISGGIYWKNHITSGAGISSKVRVMCTSTR